MPNITNRTVHNDSDDHPVESGLALHLKTEKELQESLARLNLALKVANMAWWEMDLITGNVTFEKRKAEMLGYLPEMFSHYKDFMALVHPKDYDNVMKAMCDHLDGKSGKYEIEYRILTKSNDYRWFYDTGTIVKKDLNGKPLNITGLVIDISDRKHAEEALKASKNYLNKIINSIASPIFVKDKEHKFCLVNDALCALLALPAEELLGKTGHEHFPKEQNEVFFAKDKEVFKSGKENINEEFLTDGTGKIRTIVTRKTLYTDPEGDKFLVGIINDITERKEMQEKLMKSEKLAVMGRLVADVAHEINNPLAIIIGRTQLILSRINEQPSPFKNQIETILQNAKRCKTILSNLLNYSRTIGEEDDTVNLPDLIGEAIKDVNFQYEMGAIEVAFRCNLPKNIVITGNKVALLSVFINLIRNARQAMNEKGFLTIIVEKENDIQLRIEIHDTGIGISKEHLEKLFQPFISGWKQGEGTGLGLATSLGIIETHGGKMWVESEGEGKGTKFKILLPCKLKEEKPNQALNKVEE